jgi:hypothetical protein
VESKCLASLYLYTILIDLQAFCKKNAFLDGETVSKEKVCLWLQEDILQRRTTRQAKPKGPLGKRKQGIKAAAAVVEGADSVADTDCATDDQDAAKEAVWAEAKLLAAQLNIPSTKLLAMVADDLGLEELEAREPLEGSLLKWNTIDGYILAIAEIHSL